MCDMQKMPAQDDASCEEDEMNFTGFSTVGEGGTHFVTSGGQLPVAKLQQNVSNNGTSLSQVVGMVGGVTLPEGMQYVRTIDSSATLQSTPQFISIPIALPGTKPGDPQPTVQIQVLGPNINLQPQQQQPKYQMQIPVQGFQQGGAVLTVAYSQDGNETGGMQILGNSLPEGTIRMRPGVQVVAAVPQEMQLIQPAQTQEKEQIQQNAQSASFQPCQHQVYVSGNHIVIAAPGDKVINNNNEMDIEIKKECDDNDDGTETSQEVPIEFDKDFAKTLSTQQKQAIEQFLRLNPMEGKKEIVIDRQPSEPLTDDEALLRIKKKKKYKKKPPKPARPKPGCVVIATAADGTAIYCCPECQMAYPAKEQLEMHLIVHKVERRFICGLCGAALKRKEHLERHKLGHNPERPFVCGVCRKGFKRREHLNLHTVIHSGVKTEMCNECGKGFYRKDHLRKHARSHESKRARDEANGTEQADLKPAIKINTAPVIPEITIRVPTTATQMPIQINIPQHVMSLASNNDGLLNSQNAQNDHNDVHSQLDALLAEHS